MATLEITIQRKTESGWPVVAEESQAGDFLPIRANGLLTLDVDGLPSQKTPLAYGQQLGEALFQGDIRDAFIRARANSDSSVRLLLFVEDESLQILRWERLCAPIDRRWEFASLDQRVLYSLYLPSQTDRRFPPIGRRDLRALILVANPSGLTDFGLDPFDDAQTVVSLQTALGDTPATILSTSTPAQGLPSLNALSAAVTQEQFSLLHIVAHGRYMRRSGDTILYLSDDSGQVAPVSATELLERLSRLRGAKGLPHLAFLATCESAIAEAEGALGGLAQRLVRDLGMPAVVAMTEKVTIATAETLSQKFYTHLREHGEVDRALDEATTYLSERFDVTVPALYSRLGGRPIFSDSLDRDLTIQEIDFGLSELESLLETRAPILLDTFAEQAAVLQGTLGAELTALSKEARAERQAALQDINATCEEVLDMSFNALAIGQEPPPYDDRPPFRGLFPFRADDAEFFFGREALTQSLLQRINSENFLAVLGPSGSGKSSVVQAGVLPHLRRAQPQLRVAYFTPGSDPLVNYQAALQKNQISADDLAHSLILIDQFEELFTLSLEEKRPSFIKKIHELLALSQPPKIIITMRADFWGECAPYRSLTELMQAHQELIGPMSTAELRSAMEQQARKVGLRFEADLSNTILDAVKGEPGAMPLLQHALLELWYRRHGRWLRSSEYRALGGVQKAIAETAEKIYADLADSDRSLMRDIFVRLTRVDTTAIAGEGGRDTRQRVRFEELIPAEGDPAQVRALVERLATVRLIVTNRNEATGEEEVEVAHEALIRHWPRLREWLDEDRALLKLRAGIRQAAQEWTATPLDDKPDRLIHRGSRLEEIEALLNVGRLGLNRLENSYIQACIQLREDLKAKEEAQRQRELTQARELAASAEARRAAEAERAQEAELREQEQAAAASRLRRRAVILAIVGAVAVIAAVAAVGFGRQAEVNAVTAANNEATAIANAEIAVTNEALAAENAATAEAERDRAVSAEATAQAEREEAERQAEIALSRQLAAQSQTAFNNNNPDLALLLSIEALKTRDTLEAMTAVRTQLAYPQATEHRLVGPEAGLRYISWHPAGEIFATAANDGLVQLWRAEDGQRISQIEAHAGRLWSLKWNGDGSQLLTAGNDGWVRVWNTDTGEAVLELEPGFAPVYYAVWNPAETQIATSGNGRDIIIWQATSGRQLRTLSGSPTPMVKLAWRPDGQAIAGGSFDGAARVWPAGGGQPLVLQGHAGPVTDLGWSEDGANFFTADGSGTIRLWDLPGGELRATLSGHSRLIREARWSPDGSQLLTASDDRTARVWAVGAGEEVFTLRGHSDRVTTARWSPDGSQILTTSYDNTARLWSASEGVEAHLLRGHTSTVQEAAWSPDGAQIASASEDGSARVWSLAGLTQAQGELPPLGGHQGAPVYHLALSNQGDKVLSAGADGSVGVWDVATGAELLRFGEHQATVWEATWKADDSQIASAGADRVAHVWNAETGELLFSLTGHSDDVRRVLWSGDGSRLLTASNDGTARIWDASDGTELHVLSGHEGDVNRAYWSDAPRGPQREAPVPILTAADDGSVRVWDPETGAVRLILQGHTAPLTQLRWNETRRRILTASEDGSARVWNGRNGRILLVLDHAGSVNEARWSPDESQIVTAGADGSLKVWAADSGELLTTLRDESGTAIEQVAWSADGARLLSINAGGVAQVWRIESGRVLFTLDAPEGDIQQMVWDSAAPVNPRQADMAGSLRVVTAGADGRLHVWNAETGQSLWVVQAHEAQIQQVLWSADTVYLLTTSNDGSAKLWAAADGSLIRVYEGHTGPIWEARWNGDETEFVTVSADGTARIWDTESGQTRQVLRGHDSQVWQAFWSQTEQQLLTASEDSTARIWDANTGAELYRLAGSAGLWHAEWTADEAQVLAASDDGLLRRFYVDVDRLLNVACSRTLRNMTPAEWEEARPGEVYEVTCGAER